MAEQDQKENLGYKEKLGKFDQGVLRNFFWSVLLSKRKEKGATFAGQPEFVCVLSHEGTWPRKDVQPISRPWGPINLVSSYNARFFQHQCKVYFFTLRQNSDAACVNYWC